jgi:carboxylesterase type B
VGTAAALECLRNVDFDEINYALNVTGVGPWPPVLDCDFIADWPANQLRNGNFIKVPIIIGANTDEGSAFGSGLGPNGSVVNTDEDFRYAVKSLLPSTIPSGKSVDQLVAELEYVYPNIQSVGIPNLETFPDVITENSTWASSLGLQYRRINAVVGDYYMHALRRRSNVAWAKYGIPSYSYRFDVVVNGIPSTYQFPHRLSSLSSLSPSPSPMRAFPLFSHHLPAHTYPHETSSRLPH